MEVRAGLDVDRQDVGPGLREVGEIALGLDDHQVDVEEGARLLAEGPERLDDERPDRDVRDEAAVHDVDVEPVGSGGDGLAGVGGETAEVGGEDGGGELRHGVIFSENRPAGKRPRRPASVPRRARRSLVAPFRFTQSVFVTRATTSPSSATTSTERTGSVFPLAVGGGADLVDLLPAGRGTSPSPGRAPA